MKEIITKVEKMEVIRKEIPTGVFYDQKSYEAYDGTVFSRLEDAQAHETKLIFLEIERREIEIDSYYLSDVWYKAKNQEQLDRLIKVYSAEYILFNEEELRVGEWFSVFYDYDPNGPDTVEFITLNNLQNNIRSLMEQLA